MADYQNIVRAEESIEVFPNSCPQSSSKTVVSFHVRGLAVNQCPHIDDTKRAQCPLNQSGSSTADVEPSTSSRLTFSDPMPVSQCDDTTHSSETINVNAPAVLQSKIQSQPSSSSPVNSSKCNICEYRSSIEKWRFPNGLIHCPKCLHIEAPLLRTKAKKVTGLLRSTICANCLLYCWPLCFVPYLTMPPPQNFLHCPQCFTFLGMYDERRRCIHPNSEYVVDNGCFSTDETERRAKQQEQERWKENMFMRQVY